MHRSLTFCLVPRARTKRRRTQKVIRHKSQSGRSEHAPKIAWAHMLLSPLFAALVGELQPYGSKERMRALVLNAPIDRLGDLRCKMCTTPAGNASGSSGNAALDRTQSPAESVTSEKSAVAVFSTFHQVLVPWLALTVECVQMWVWLNASWWTNFYFSSCMAGLFDDFTSVWSWLKAWLNLPLTLLCACCPCERDFEVSFSFSNRACRVFLDVCAVHGQCSMSMVSLSSCCFASARSHSSAERRWRQLYTCCCCSPFRAMGALWITIRMPILNVCSQNSNG